MLSKLLAGLVASMAVAFAGYSYVHHDGSGCCGSKLHHESVVSETSCCESAAPSCCQAAATAEVADCCADKCPSEKAATTVAADCCTSKCPAEKAAATTVVSEKAPSGDHK